MSDADNFEANILNRVAGAIGVSYADMLANYRRMEIRITPKILRLAASSDQRKVKRGVRLYYQLNGGDAPHSFLMSKVSEVKLRRGAEVLNRAVTDMARDFLSGTVFDTPEWRRYLVGLGHRPDLPRE